MSALNIESARTVVNNSAWRWMPGMLAMSDPDCVPRCFGSDPYPTDLRARVISVALGRWFGVGEYSVDHPDAEGEPMNSSDFPGALPDLSDTATLGCVVSLGILPLALLAPPPERADSTEPLSARNPEPGT